MSEDDTDTLWIGGEAIILRTGLDRAEAINRSRFAHGEIDVHEFEREVERLLVKRERLTAAEVAA